MGTGNYWNLDLPTIMPDLFLLSWLKKDNLSARINILEHLQQQKLGQAQQNCWWLRWKKRSIRLPDTETAQPAAITILAQYASKSAYMWESQEMETNTKTHAQDISYDSWDETGMQFSEETPLKTKQSKGKCIRYEPFEGKRHQSCQHCPVPPPFWYHKQPQGNKS